MPQPRGSGKIEHIVEPTTSRGYWLYLPESYVNADERARSNQRWPLVVTFHGMKPFDNAYPQAREWQQEADRYGYIVVAPELRTFHLFGQFPLRTASAAFLSDEEATLAIMDRVFQTTRADPSNVLSTSWSSGGYMAHYMLNRHPDRFTALAVRQSNFSPTVLHPDLTRQSRYHPVLIINTQNDFAICKKESGEAVKWYETHNYQNVFWIHIKDKGHERTPDMAAYFFSLVTGSVPNKPAAVLVGRQAIDGNEEGIKFLSGELKEFQAPPSRAMTARVDVPRNREAPTPRPSRVQPRTGSNPNASASLTRTAAVPQRRSVPRNPLKIRVSSAIGIEPLHLGFSAECPTAWRESADFLWTLDGESIGSGINGQKTLIEPGEHTLAVLVVTARGDEHRASRTIRVLPRLDSASSSR